MPDKKTPEPADAVPEAPKRKPALILPPGVAEAAKARKQVGGPPKNNLRNDPHSGMVRGRQGAPSKKGPLRQP